MIATMTIIIAQKTTTGVLLAADNHSHDGTRRTLMATPKLVQVSPRVAYGTSGHTRLANILRGKLDFPVPDDYDEKSKGLVFDIYESKLAAFFRNIVKGEFPELTMWAIVAVDDVIFDVGPDGGLIRVADSFTATGEAELVALGALHALGATGQITDALCNRDIAEMMMTKALNACAAFIDSIRPPWTFVETKKPV